MSDIDLGAECRRLAAENEALISIYKEILENKCVRQDDFSFWHGKLLDVTSKTYRGSPYTEGSYRGFRPSDNNER